MEPAGKLDLFARAVCFVVGKWLLVAGGFAAFAWALFSCHDWVKANTGERFDAIGRWVTGAMLLALVVAFFVSAVCDEAKRLRGEKIGPDPPP